jgi:hypothetical protein
MKPVSRSAGHIVRERSYETITPAVLDRLALLGREVMEGFFLRNPRWGAYRQRLLCLVLAQGAALHYVDGRSGVKDFDVWAFYERDDDVGPVPPRGRRGIRDFGPSEHGRHPDDAGYSGRRVDVVARSISRAPGEDGIAAVQNYLRTNPAETPRLLSKKAMVVLEPAERRGEVVWPGQGT